MTDNAHKPINKACPLLLGDLSQPNSAEVRITYNIRSSRIVPEGYAAESHHR